MNKIRISKQARKYIILLTVIAVILVTLSATSLNLRKDLPVQAKVAIILFFILAVVLELFTINISKFGYAALSFCAYFALIISNGYPLAVIIASLALAVRMFVVKRNIWLRFADFSATIINVCLTGVIYTVLSQGFSFLTWPQNIIAIIISGAVFYGLEVFLASSLVDLLDEKFIINFKKVQIKLRLSTFTIIPMGILLVIVYQKINVWALIFIVPLIFSLIKGMEYAIREIDIADQEVLLDTINNLKVDLDNYKEQSRDLSSDLNKKVDEQSILVEMSEALGTSVNLESTLEIVVAMIRKMMVYQSCVIFLISDESSALVAHKSVTPYRDILEYSSLLKLEESIVNLVVQSKKPILIPDMQTMGEQRIFKDERSVVCVPLIVKNEIIGVIYVGSKKAGTYNEDHLHLLSILGNAASNAIRTSQLYDAAEQKSTALQKANSQLDYRIHQFEMLLNIGQKLGSSLNIDEAQKIIIDGIEDMFSYQSVAVFLIKGTAGSQVLVPTKYRSPYELFFENLQLSLDDQSNVMGWISIYRKPLLLNDTRNTKIQTILENERSVMLVPMIVENELTGAIYLGHADKNYYDEDMLNLLEAVSHNGAMAIKNAEIYERTAKKAITDGLTGLYTHRYFQERLAEEINHARRRKMGLALIMIDADHFKSLNDTCGHPEGDKCLKTLSDIMRKYTRDSDVICRVGGDEFVIMLKEIDKKNAFRKAEAVRQAVQSKFHASPVQITTSIGLACFPEDGGTKKDLVAAVDAALYKSKKLGRNRVTYATGPVTADFKKEPLSRE